MCLVLDPACFYRSLTLNLSLNILQAVEDVTTHPLKVDMANPKYVICWLRWCHGGNLIDPIGSRYIRAISVTWISTHMMRTRRNQILLNPLYVTGLYKSTRVQEYKSTEHTEYTEQTEHTDLCDFGAVKIYRHSFARSKIKKKRKNSFGI